jgi:hypothetical protein
MFDVVERFALRVIDAEVECRVEEVRYIRAPSEGP